MTREDRQQWQQGTPAKWALKGLFESIAANRTHEKTRVGSLLTIL
jgi:hypothetical protein